MELIQSAQNPAIRRVRSVGAGREPNALLLEGERLVADAIKLGLELELCLVARDQEQRALEFEGAGVNVRLVEPEVLRRASQLTTPPGVIAVGPTPALLDLSGLATTDAGLVVVACGVADPGNLGALARTAEAAGVGALILIGGASPWNSKALRGSMGSLLRLPIAREEQAGAVRATLDERGYRHVRAATRGGADPFAFDWSSPVVLWLSSETGDLPQEAQDLEAVTISMADAPESLNVTAAAAVLLFAARRGR